MEDLRGPEAALAKAATVERDPRTLIERVEILEGALQGVLEQLENHGGALARLGDRAQTVERHVGL